MSDQPKPPTTDPNNSPVDQIKHQQEEELSQDLKNLEQDLKQQEDASLAAPPGGIDLTATASSVTPPSPIDSPVASPAGPPTTSPSAPPNLPPTPPAPVVGASTAPTPAAPQPVLTPADPGTTPPPNTIDTPKLKPNGFTRKTLSMIIGVITLGAVVTGAIGMVLFTSQQQNQIASVDDRSYATGLPDSNETGCCSSDSQCVSWYGSGATCTNGNGACASTWQCKGSTGDASSEETDGGSSGNSCGSTPDGSFACGNATTCYKCNNGSYVNVSRDKCDGQLCGTSSTITCNGEGHQCIDTTCYSIKGGVCGVGGNSYCCNKAVDATNCGGCGSNTGNPDNEEVPGDNTKKGVGESCYSVMDCSSPLICATCPDGTVKFGQLVCAETVNVNGACGGVSSQLEEGDCTPLDRKACQDCSETAVANPATTQQAVCNMYGEWECLHTDRCGAGVGSGGYENGSGCTYDSTCATGYCDRSAPTGNYLGTCSTRKESGSCDRNNVCSSLNCVDGMCGAPTTSGSSSDNMCGDFNHGSFIGCGNLYGYPDNYDCFCSYGTTYCEEDLDKLSCGAPAGEEPIIPESPDVTDETETSENPTYDCNSDCDNDDQCETANASYICSSNKCRHSSYPSEDDCQPPQETEFICSNIISSVPAPKIGDSITFTCQAGGNGMDEVTKAQFQYSVDGGSFSEIGMSTFGNTNKAGVSSNIIMTKPGNYEVQCRVCSDTKCSSWDTPTSS